MIRTLVLVKLITPQSEPSSGSLQPFVDRKDTKMSGLPVRQRREGDVQLNEI